MKRRRFDPEAFAAELREKGTQYEKVARQALINRGIHFWFQKLFHPYIADFYLPDRNIVLEIDDKSHYTKDGLIKDAIRTADLKRKHGILEVVRWTNRQTMSGSLPRLLDKLVKDYPRIAKCDFSDLDAALGSDRGYKKAAFDKLTELGFTVKFDHKVNRFRVPIYVVENRLSIFLDEPTESELSRLYNRGMRFRVCPPIGALEHSVKVPNGRPISHD